jgi:hypothetical protein
MIIGVSTPLATGIFILSEVSDPAPESTPTSYPMGTRLPSLEVNGQNVMLNTQFHPTLNSRKYGIVLPLPVHLHDVISGHTNG